jgi:hypothetical protein
MWFANNSCVRYPHHRTWTHSPSAIRLAAQPKVGGGYFIWSGDRYFGHSATGAWTYWLPQARGEVAGIPGKDCVDDAGNFWALRMPAVAGDWETLDYRRPDGTWVSPTPPYPGVTYGTSAFKAYADRRAILVDNLGEVFQFDGTSWVSLGTWRAGASSSVADVDAAGNVWVSGNGGAAKYDAQTGQWQRYRVTNTANFDSFNRDLTIDPVNGYVYTGANAAPGVGGMDSFDGTRWTCWDQLTYGLGHDWPFPNDDCQAVAYRPSNGRIAVNPIGRTAFTNGPARRSTRCSPPAAPSGCARTRSAASGPSGSTSASASTTGTRGRPCRSPPGAPRFGRTRRGRARCGP